MSGPERSRVTLGVAISVPSPWAQELSAWRRRVGDPEGGRVPPHVTLLPPTAVDAAARDEIDEHLAAAAAACAPFDLHLGGTGTFRPVSDVVFVVVTAGMAQCKQLERTVRSGPLARETRFPYHPHITVAHDIAAAGLDAAYEGLAAFEARFRVSAFTAFEQGAAGVWQPTREFALQGDDVAGIKDRVLDAARAQRAKRPWLEHVIRAYGRYKATNGDHLAAAITYFSFLAIFPLLLLAISVGGFVLVRNPGLISDLKGLIADNVPGGLGESLAKSVDSLIDNRGKIGIVALLGVAYSGLGWIGNLRTALQVVWSREASKQPFLKAKLADLIVLVGLGLGIVVSLALTAGGTAAAKKLVELVNLDDIPGMSIVLAIVGIVLALAADVMIFAFLFVRLPGRSVRYRTVLRGALFAAVGYEILKVVGTYYIAKVGSNPTYGVFGSAIGILVWIDLVSRYMLFSAAWTATGQQPKEMDDDSPEPGFAVPVQAKPADGQVLGPAPVSPVVARRDPPRPAAVAGVLVGAGAAVGAGAVAGGRRLWRRRNT